MTDEAPRGCLSQALVLQFLVASAIRVSANALEARCSLCRRMAFARELQSYEEELKSLSVQISSAEAEHRKIADEAEAAQLDADSSTADPAQKAKLGRRHAALVRKLSWARQDLKALQHEQHGLMRGMQKMQARLGDPGERNLPPVSCMLAVLWW